MYKETTGKVVAVHKQWWLKINAQILRTHPLDGASFPHIIKVQYIVNGKQYCKRKWINAGQAVPCIGFFVTVEYDENKPKKAKICL